MALDGPRHGRGFFKGFLAAAAGQRGRPMRKKGLGPDGQGAEGSKDTGRCRGYPPFLALHCIGLERGLASLILIISGISGSCKLRQHEE